MKFIFIYVTVGVEPHIGHLAGLESCGYPYLYPLGTLESFKFKDIFYRKDLNEISNRVFLPIPPKR
ncbi:MAG: spore germination protein [Spirochaetaceae bacterium]|nr:spore germination protein [Spirochaetaceae bacterium]